MRQNSMLRLFGLVLLMIFLSIGSFAQAPKSAVEVEIVSEEDLTPSVIKGLPNWENLDARAVHIKTDGELIKSLGERPVFNLIKLGDGTEAATANYEGGKMLVVEYLTPQASVEADNLIRGSLASNPPNPPIFYRRIGNYSAFVFDAPDETAANALLDQVKYEKTVRWLGENPYLLRQAEQAFVKTSSEIFLSTFLAIALGLGSTLLLGIGVGALVFYLRKQKRAEMTAFSDAGGMVRLNLDEMTEGMPDRLLKG